MSVALAQDIPSGFKVNRYDRVWERNPFTLVKPTVPERLPSAFEQLFLASWLKDGGEEVILVQNLETNEVQRITAVPNQNNLRLVEVHLNPNPQFVELVIADGKEQGTVKFRFDEEAPSGPTTSASAQFPANGATAQAPASRIYPGVPRVHVEGGPPQSTRPRDLWRKHFASGPQPEHSNSGQN